MSVLLILAAIGLANAFRILWLAERAPADDAVWNACLAKGANE